jgi:pyruvate carboxylase subunit B
VEGGITSSMQGMVLKIKVNVGDKVTKGSVVAVLEAMKMENDIQAESDGVVEEIFVSEGDTVNAGDTLMVIK